MPVWQRPTVGRWIAVKNVRERPGQENRQIDPAGNARKGAAQGDGTEQQAQRGEREWQMTFSKM